MAVKPEFVLPAIRRHIERIRRPRKEDRFQIDERSRGWTGLVKNCLKQFTPWDSGCVIPDGFDPERDELPGLAFRGHDPDEQHPVEVNRMHSIIDPNCYGRLTRALGLDDPEQRLAIPKFTIQEDDGQDSRSDGKWRHPAGLTDEELAGISKDLAERAARRKSIKPRFLSVVANGREVGRLDLTEGNRLPLELSGWVDLIEVRTRDDEGEVKLAVLLLSAADRSSKWVVEHTVALEGGQKITFGVSFKMDEYGDPAAAVVEMAYKETGLVKGASAFLGQVREQGKRLLDQSARSARQTPLTGLTRGFVFTGHSSSSSPTSNTRAPVSAKELIQVLIEGAHSEALLRFVGMRLVAVMEQAHAFRRMDILDATSRVLLSMPGSQDLESIGRYYYGLCVLGRGKGDLERAARLLESVAERAPSPYSSQGADLTGRELDRAGRLSNRSLVQP